MNKLRDSGIYEKLARDSGSRPPLPDPVGTLGLKQIFSIYSVYATNLCHFGLCPTVYRHTWELQVFRDANNLLCGRNHSLERTEDFFRKTASESLDSESLLRGYIFSVLQFM